MAMLEPGLADPVEDAQHIFRQVLNAFAHPGTIVMIDRPSFVPGGRLGRAAIALALALVDLETPVWLDAGAAKAASHLRFHCNCPIAAEPSRAAFMFVTDPAHLPPLADLPLGEDAYPDRGALLVIEVETIGSAPDLVLTGPGIEAHQSLSVRGLPAPFWTERAALARLFPRGIDLVLTAGDRLTVLPRTTQIARG